MNDLYKSFRCAIVAAVLLTWAMMPTSLVLAQEASGGGDDPPVVSQQRFPFEAYDYFRLEVVDDEVQLVAVDRHDLGLFTPLEHFQQVLNIGSTAWAVISSDYWTAWGQMGDTGQWLSAFSVTLDSQGAGIVMVKKQDDAPEPDGGTPQEPKPTDQVIVVVSGFGPFPGVPDNNSTDVAGVIHDKLKELDIATEKVIIDVFWGEPDRKVDEVVCETTVNYPDKKIIWIGLGVGGGFKLETVGQNDQLNAPDAQGDFPPAPGQNETGGPPTSDGGYDPDTVLCVLHSHGVEVVFSDSMDGYLCTSLCYKLHRLDELGVIHTGIFVHIPGDTDGSINDKFADGLIDLIKIMASQLTDDSGASPDDGAEGAGQGQGDGQ